MSITLLSVVTSEDYMERTLKSMVVSLKARPFDKAVIICPRNSVVAPECGITPIYKDIEWVNYSGWVLKNLVDYVNTDFALCVQWDSCIINPDLWDDKFLEYDYIGAPWPNNFVNRVGNGGMSCRSKKFLEECVNLHYYKQVGENGEDYFACVTCYEYMLGAGIKFAPLDLARKFSVEYSIPEAPHSHGDLSSYNSFGFHGVFNKAGMEYINDNCS